MNFKKGLAITLSAAMLLSTAMLQASAATLKETVEINSENNTDATYFEYASSHNETQVITEPIKVNIGKTLGEEPVSFEINVETEGMYNFGLSYKAADSLMPAFELAMQIDGAYPFESAKDLIFSRMWQDEEGIVKDGFGNEYAPSQIQYDKYFFNYAADNKTENYDKYYFYLTAGVHNITLTSVKGAMDIEYAVFAGEEIVKEYSADESGDIYKGEPIILEGEKADIKSTYFLIGKSDTSTSKITPFDGKVQVVNYIGGGNWKTVGETLVWTTPELEAGYYNIGFSFRQSSLIGGIVFRSLTVDGVSPFIEAKSVPFEYDYNWQKNIYADDEGNPYKIYLSEGKHEIALTVTAGDISPVKVRLNESVAKIGDLYLDINMITGETVDIYRNYDLFDQVPDMENRLNDIKKLLKEAADTLVEITGETSGSNYSVINNMILACDQMLNDKFNAHRYKDYFYSNYCSVSAVLKDLQNMPLDLDKIVLFSPDDDEPFEKVNIIENFAFSVKRFFASFARDYDSLETDEEKSVKVWVNWGQDQVQVLRSMADRSFTQKTGLKLDLQLVNASIIQGVLSGNGPDVLLSHSRTEPVNLAMRGVLVDLSQFDDFDEVITRFNEGATTSFKYKGGTYALPDSQSFPMMFYRKDILEELELEVPTTWTEFREVAKRLARYNMNVSIPKADVTDVKASLFTTLLAQNGLSLYTDSGDATTLKTSGVMEVFTEWTNFYTKMKFPITLDFYNRFRTGTTPIGIADYTQYTTFKVAAPEIEGLWGMAPVPGTVREDGTIDHSVSGGNTSCFILKGCKDKDNAWELLKWWTETDTQFSFSNGVESILGPTGRRAPSTVEALSMLSWDEGVVEVLCESWDDIVEIPEYPGSYYVARSIYQAYWNVVNDNLNPKDMLTKFGDEANEEIARKWEQYTNRG